MLIKLSHLLGKAQIKTASNDADDPVTPVITAEPPELEEMLRRALSRSYGHYAHAINLEQTTNLDLISAARDLDKFEVILDKFEVISVEPEIKANPLPKDVQS